MSYFGNELWRVLTRPFKLKDDGECYKWIQVLGSLMDESKEIIFTVRRLWFIRHSLGKVLDIRGDERDLARWYDETDEYYRMRVEGAFALYAAGGTLPGMQKALQQIGYGDIRITERSGPTWSHFLLSLDLNFGRTMKEQEWAILNFSVWRMKPAHTMPMYFISALPDPPQKIQIRSSPGILGEIKTNHSIWLDNTPFYYINGSLFLDGSIKLGQGWCQVLYNNEIFIGYFAVNEDDWRWQNNPLHRVTLVSDIFTKRSFVNKTIYRLDGSEFINGSLLLDSWRGANTNFANHATFLEIFDQNGISQGKEVIN